MRTLEEQITRYAAYHRDRRNIATHFIGIPMIVFSVVLALGTGTFSAGSWTTSLAAAGTVAAALYYLRLDLTLGLAMVVYLALNCIGSDATIAAVGVRSALWLALAIFVAGWILQFWGHKFEGMKPAFLDDMAGLIIGPLFMMTEVFFALGLKPKLREYVEARVGPVVARRVHVAA